MAGIRLRIQDTPGPTAVTALDGDASVTVPFPRLHACLCEKPSGSPVTINPRRSVEF